MAVQNFYLQVFFLCNSLRYVHALWPAFNQYKHGKEEGFHICDKVVTAVSMLIAKTMVNILIDNLKILLTSIDEVTYLWEDHMAR